MTQMKVKYVHGREGDTLSVWFEDPKKLNNLPKGRSFTGKKICVEALRQEAP